MPWTYVKRKKYYFTLIIQVISYFSVLQPEQTLPEKYQLARAALHWYCPTKIVSVFKLSFIIVNKMFMI
jgi:hypothetical protein